MKWKVHADARMTGHSGFALLLKKTFQCVCHQSIKQCVLNFEQGILVSDAYDYLFKIYYQDINFF
jgi:hypothetical protein